MAKKPKKIIINAALWKRALAYIFDILILNLIVIMPFKDKISSLTGAGKGFFELQEFFLTNPDKLFSAFLVSFIIFILFVLYFSILEFKLRQSIGKMLFNIKVVSKVKQINYWQFFIRNITKPLTIIFLLDIIYMFFNEKKQRYFEKISKTQVIQEVNI